MTREQAQVIRILMLTLLAGILLAVNFSMPRAETLLPQVTRLVVGAVVMVSIFKFFKWM